jgi:hypothetical protein
MYWLSLVVAGEGVVPVEVLAEAGLGVSLLHKTYRYRQETIMLTWVTVGTAQVLEGAKERAITEKTPFLIVFGQ